MRAMMINSVIDTPTQNFVFLADQKRYSSSIIIFLVPFSHPGKAYQACPAIEVLNYSGWGSSCAACSDAVYRG